MKLDVREDAAAVARAAAEHFARTARAAVAERGAFRVALSGGRTPKALFHLLTGDAYGDLPWSEMDFFWGDERCVARDHLESNYRAANAVLLARVPVVRDRVYAVPDAGKAFDIAAAYEKTLRRVFAGQDFPRFDLLLLGLGADGHTASLFAGGEAVKEKERWVVPAYAPPPAAVRSRVTLTPPAINGARSVLMLVTGGGKSERLRELLEEDFPPERLPAKAVAPRDGELIILADREAAARLST